LWLIAFAQGGSATVQKRTLPEITIGAGSFAADLKIDAANVDARIECTQESCAMYQMKLATRNTNAGLGS
jgi:hypothetical protein